MKRDDAVHVHGSIHRDDVDITYLGCYDVNTGHWFVDKSTDGFWTTTYAGTVPVSGDFDGDGISDFGCYYLDGGWWYVYESSINDIFYRMSCLCD